MLDFSSYFLASSSISAVLLGICVSLRNNSFSGLLHPEVSKISVGNGKYKETLKRSGKYSTFAGGFFGINTILGIIAFLLSHSLLSGYPNLLWYGTLFISGLFILGVLFLGRALMFEYLEFSWPFAFELNWPPISFTPPEKDSEDRPDTVPMDEQDSHNDSDPDVESSHNESSTNHDDLGDF